MTRWKVVVVMVGMTLLAACSAIGDAYRMDEFDKTARAYGRLIRWSDFERAVVFFKLDASTTLPDVERLRQFQVTSYDALDSRLSDDKRTITQIVKIQYLVVSRMAERTLTDQQIWEYSPTLERWVLTSGFPPFK